MTLSLAREIAYDAFAAVVFDRQKPEDYMENAYSEHDKKLKRLDRQFIKEILFGSLRWYSKLYWILQHTSKRDLGKSTPEIVAALVVGTYQIYYMDKVPDRTAVSESVEYVRKKGQASACSFVNGILRQIARRAEYFKKPDKEKEPIEYLTVQYAHPRWLVERWSRQFKYDRLKTLLSENNTVPPYTIRSNLMRFKEEQIHDLQVRLLKEESTHSDRRPLRTSLHLKDPPKFDPESLFAKGFYTIQDESSQLTAMMVAPEPGQTIVDACAGPGAKLSHVYEIGQEAITLIAVEKEDRQLERAKMTMARLDHHKLSYVFDSFLNFKPEAPVDKVLLDAPSSGLGALRRHPEGKWQKTESAIKKMADLQRQLLEHAISIVKPEGEVIYSVTSFEREETTAHLSYLEKFYGDAQVEVISPVGRFPDYFRKYVTKTGLLAVFSGNTDQMDGFTSFILKVHSNKKREAVDETD